MNRVKARSEEIIRLWKVDDDLSIKSEETKYSLTNNSNYDNSREIIKEITVSPCEDLVGAMISEKNELKTVSSEYNDIKKCKENKLERIEFDIDHVRGQV